MADSLRILMTGDLVLDEPGADALFDHVRDVLKGADVAIGHVEVPHTDRGKESVGDIPAPAAPPENLAAIGRAGFKLASLAGNHIHDRGPEGVADTIAGLKAAGVVSAGAGMDLGAARKPAIVEAKGRRVVLLSYNCVGPKQGWAAAKRAGCAYVRVISHYEMENANPGGPPEVYTFATPDSLEAMQADIEGARAQADVVIVSLHKGLVHQVAKLAMYERQVARAAIDAGADVVFGHHAHICKGIEIWRGKPIFHGLGNFVTVTKALNVEGNDSPERKAWAIKRRELFGFEPMADYPNYPFHPESRNAMIASVSVGADGSLAAGFVPCWIEPNGAPRPVSGDKAREVAAYIEAISKREGFRTRIEAAGGEVRVS